MSEELVITPEDEFRKSLVESKKNSESYVVLSMYKSVDLFLDNNIKVDDISDNVWKFYFAIMQKAIKQGKRVLDDIVIGMIVADNENLEKMYEEYGGYQTIANGLSFVEVENFNSYLVELKKTNALIRLHDLGYPVMKNIEAYKMLSTEGLQNALESALSEVFADIDVDEKVVDLKDGLWDVVMEAHEGLNRGFPYSSPLLTESTNGQALGNITMVSANSGVGKTFFTIAQVLPNMIEFNEKLLIMANEEGEKKWKQAIIVWACNNIFDGDFNKARFNQGSFSKEEFALLRKGVDWLNEQMEAKVIQFINFSRFSMKKAIKLIRRHSQVEDIKYYILDTLKLDSDQVNENTQAWLQLQLGMVDLFDTVKEEALNRHVWVTYQLGKSALLTRYLSQNSLGVSKNVVDPISTLMLIRKALDSEKDGGKNEVKIKTKNGLKTMDKEKEYFIVFLGKNRANATHRQLVFEIDQGLNTMKEIGTCVIEQDI